MTISAEVATEGVRRARRQLLLWSGFLLLWVFVGVDPAGLQGELWGATRAISNPGAFPVCLLLVVSYFLYRWCNEWIISEPHLQSSGNILDAVITFSIGWIAVANGLLYVLIEPDLLRPTALSGTFSFPLVSFVAALGGISRARRLRDGAFLFRRETLGRVLLAGRRPHTWTAGDHLTIWGFIYGENAVLACVVGLPLMMVLGRFGWVAVDAGYGLLQTGTVVLFLLVNYLLLPKILLGLGLIRRRATIV